MKLKADAVFEGGGVKGIGLVGAISQFENAGYEFENLAGTSAGAIVAALIAAGYSSAEIKDELEKLDYSSFKDEGFLDKIGIVGKGLSIGFEYGIYEGDFLEEWIETLLEKKGLTRFGDIRTGSEDERYKYKLQVVAADISDRRLLVLPGALADFGCDPDLFSISRAVRMSMSIPIFFEPVRFSDVSGRTHLIVDGGILSNYPIWLLDDGSSEPPWPTFGFKLVEPDLRALKHGKRQGINNPVSYLKALAGTMMDAHDNYHISVSKGDYDRTVGISTVVEIGGGTHEVKTTDFNISRDESAALYTNGVEAAKSFLNRWNFDNWKEKYRAKAPG